MASATVLSFDLNNSPQNTMGDILNENKNFESTTPPALELNATLIPDDINLIELEICDYTEQNELANNVASPDEEPLDPRIKEELETMNRSSDEINNMEAQLIRLKDDLSRVMGEGNIRLDDVKLKLGDRVINNAKPYYKTLIKAKKLHKAVLQSTRDFDSSTQARQLAKDELKNIEELFVGSSVKQSDDKKISEAEEIAKTRKQTEILERLNYAIKTVNDLDEKVLQRETEHRIKSTTFNELVKDLSTCKNKHKRNIIKSKKYFEIKYQYEHRLRDLIASRKFLIEQLNQAKVRYSVAMKNLETISLQIHKMRGDIPELDEKIISNPLFLDGDESSYEDSSLGLREIDPSLANEKSICTSIATDPGSVHNLNALDDILVDQMRSTSVSDDVNTKIHPKTSHTKFTYI